MRHACATYAPLARRPGWLLAVTTAAACPATLIDPTVGVVRSTGGWQGHADRGEQFSGLLGLRWDSMGKR